MEGRPLTAAAGHDTVPTSLDVVIPVLNEEKALATSTAAVAEYISANLGDCDWRIRIADNGSTDSTPEIAQRLAEQHDRLSYLRIEQRGRGRALREAWLDSKADVLCYMDVDLSTDLTALPKLVTAIIDDGYDIAIGSRLARGSEVLDRPPHREFISRVYNLIVRTMFLTRFRDAQCGFKAIGRRAADQLVPIVRDTTWFFDSELLILAEKNGYRIKEVPVTWRDDPDSRVRLIGTSYGDLKGLLRLRLGGLRQASRLLATRVQSH